jgi:hypothetical protein
LRKIEERDAAQLGAPMPVETSFADLQPAWLALATSGLVLLGFSSLAASLAASFDGKLYRHHVFGVRAITTNSLYLSLLGFFPIILIHFGTSWEPICVAIKADYFSNCASDGETIRTHVWSWTSVVIILGLLWQFGVQVWRIFLTKDTHDSRRIAIFFLAPAPIIFWTQVANISANQMPLALLGATFFATTACGHFYNFLHRIGHDAWKNNQLTE